METTTLSITGMTCGHCVASVRKALSAVPGVQVQDVRIGSATLEATTPAALDGAVAAVQDAGYDATVGGTPAAPRLTQLGSRRGA
jgi:copper chaperone CopZ